MKIIILWPRMAADDVRTQQPTHKQVVTEGKSTERRKGCGGAGAGLCMQVKDGGGRRLIIDDCLIIWVMVHSAMVAI